VEIAAMPVPGTTELDLTARLIDGWVAGCNIFLDWAHKHVIEKEPTPSVLAAHRRNLKVILHFGRLLYLEAGEPDSQIHRFAPEIKGKLAQLEEEWDMIHNPLPDAEANAVIEKYFPGEPRFGTAA
jgi:hypothetical protein